MLSSWTETPELTPKILYASFIISCNHYLFLGHLVLEKDALQLFSMKIHLRECSISH